MKQEFWSILAVLVFIGLGCATARTPLMKAVSESDSNAVTLALNSGVNVNEQSDYDIGPGGKKWTPLHLAAKRGDAKMVRLLLDNGADPGITTAFGWTPLDWAEHQGHTFVANMIREAMENRYVTAGPGPTPLSKTPGIQSETDVLSLLTDKHSIIDVDEPPYIQIKLNHNAYAIVIGIERYRQSLPTANFAVRDAQVMTGYLTKVLGYPEENVVTLINDRALQSDFTKYFEKWLPNNVEPESTVFVYFSGHGAPDPKTGTAYLVPYDGDPTFIAETGYSLSRMYAALGKLPAKEIIVALDSCFSGAGGRSVLAKGARPLVMNLQTGTTISKNMTVLSASAGDQISSTYDEKGHGLFTYFLLNGIKNEDMVNPDGSLRMADLYDYLKPQVERIARKQYNNEQTPQLIGSEKN